MSNVKDVIEEALREYYADAGTASDWPAKLAGFITGKLDEAGIMQESGLTDAERKDRDETRRLLYMALFAPKTERWNLAGTLAHALLHHSLPASTDYHAVQESVLDYVLKVVQGEARDWAFSHIDRLTAELVLDSDPAGNGVTGEPGAL